MDLFKKSYLPKFLILQALAVGILGAFIFPKLLVNATIFIQGTPEERIEQQLRMFGSKTIEKGLITALTETTTESYDVATHYFKTYLSLALFLIFILSLVVYSATCLLFKLLGMVLIGELILIIVQALQLAGLDRILTGIEIVALIVTILSLFMYKSSCPEVPESKV